MERGAVGAINNILFSCLGLFSFLFRCLEAKKVKQEKDRNTNENNAEAEDVDDDEGVLDMVGDDDDGGDDGRETMRRCVVRVLLWR